jgi:hypothetical protein
MRQVCTGVMLHGYGHVKTLCTELQAFMDKHGFTSVEDFRGYNYIPNLLYHKFLVKLFVMSLSVYCTYIFVSATFEGVNH